MKKALKRLTFYFFILLISFISICANAQTKEELEQNLRQEVIRLLKEAGKKVTEEAIELGINEYKASVNAQITKPEVCEANIINNCSYSCNVNKQKETNQAYIEIVIKKGLLQFGKSSIPDKENMPNISIELSFEMKDKLYTHSITKRDYKDDGKFHLYWDIDYDDVDKSKAINVTLNGTTNAGLSKTQELSIDDYYNSTSWFAPSVRGADVKAYGVVERAGFIGFVIRLFKLFLKIVLLFIVIFILVVFVLIKKKKSQKTNTSSESKSNINQATYSNFQTSCNESK